MSNDNDKKFVLEHFGLFLAAGLMGGRPNLYSKCRKDNLEHRLDSSLAQKEPAATNNPSVSFPAYWRSSLFHDDVDSASFLHDAPQAEADASLREPEDKPMMDLLFLDATFLFQTQLALVGEEGKNDDNNNGTDNAKATTSQNSTLSLSFGAFLRRRKPKKDTTDEYFYVQSPPVTTEFLIDHFNQHGSLVADTSAIHVANPMIRALKRLSKGAVVNVKFDETNARLSQVRIPLVYDMGGEEEDHPSYLTIFPRNGSVHPLDSTVASTWLCSILSQNASQAILSSPPSEDKQEEGQQPSAVETVVQKETILSTRDSKTLLAYYNGWKEKAASWLEQCKKAAATRQQSSTQEEENQDSTAGTGNTTNEITAKSSPSPSKAKSSKKDVKKKRPQAYGAQRIGGKKKKKTTATFAPVSKPK